MGSYRRINLCKRGDWIMKHTLQFVVCIFFISLISVIPAMGQSSSPVGFSLFDPVQWPARSNSITGVRFNVIYANHRDLTGLDLGLLFPVNQVNGNLSGIQFGVYNGVRRHGGGIQLSGFNYVQREFTGVQSGLGNLNGGHTNGVQFGFYNQARSFGGVQLGIINVTNGLDGLQIGIANFKSEPRESAPASGPAFFPIVNWSF